MIDAEISGSPHAAPRDALWTDLARGALETFTIIGCFAATGLAWAAISGDVEPISRPGPAQTIYASEMPDDPESPPRAEGPVLETAVANSAKSAPPDASVWLIDGFNVLHAGLLGGRDRSNWWTETKRQELLDRVEGYEDATAEDWIVFDGRHDAPESPQTIGPRCVFAPSADAWLVERVREAGDPTRIAVVTGDRQVAGRARSRGARVVSPRDFLARCPV